MTVKIVSINSRNNQFIVKLGITALSARHVSAIPAVQNILKVKPDTVDDDDSYQQWCSGTVQIPYDVSGQVCTAGQVCLFVCHQSLIIGHWLLAPGALWHSGQWDTDDNEMADSGESNEIRTGPYL